MVGIRKGDGCRRSKKYFGGTGRRWADWGDRGACRPEKNSPSGSGGTNRLEKPTRAVETKRIARTVPALRRKKGFGAKKESRVEGDVGKMSHLGPEGEARRFNWKGEC